jgi:excinuclease ABC subunit A
VTASAKELDHIHIQGAREHNLKNLDVRIPKKQLVVLTGVSGSGKSSLAFDTLYAEGQRRYVESLSAYARQFLGQMEKPRYDTIRGLAPTISIEQKSASKNPRSTVGTITEVYDYLRVLFARCGVQHCTSCGRPVGRQTAEQMVDRLMALAAGTRFSLLAPVVKHRKGHYQELFRDLLKRGFTRVRVDGSVVMTEEAPALDKDFKHSIEIVVDRLVAKDDLRPRLTDSVETALREAEGALLVEIPGQEELLFSEKNACPFCEISFPDLEPSLFSFNTPMGMCTSCNGLGNRLVVDPALVVPDEEKSVNGGAIAPWANAMKTAAGWNFKFIQQACDALGIDRNKPWHTLKAEHQQLLLHGSTQEIEIKWQGKRSAGTWKTSIEGVIPGIERKWKATESGQMRAHYQAYMRSLPCPDCGGSRLRPESRAVKVGRWTLPELTRMTISEARQTVAQLGLDGNAATIAVELVKEIGARLGFLVNVGLDYLTLDRLGPTLSGGESQRIRLAAQVGTELSGVIYILDEPSIGLHQRDNRKLLLTLKHLRDIGNTVVVVEHDEETIAESDWVVDFGPGAGRDGGHVVFAGTPQALLKDERSITGQYLSGRLRIETPHARRKPGKDWLEIRGCQQNNLRDVDVRIPAACLVAVTGVSGAGKSSLVNGTLSPALENHFFGAQRAIGKHKEIKGLQHFDKVIDIDQTPIGRTPRSNPATYTKVFDLIRDVFAQTKEARAAGFDKSRFSFNVKGGRCEACQGDGSIQIEMHFLADVYVPCEVCHGRRFNEATLRVHHRGKSIADVLEMTVAEALEHFAHHRNISRILKTLEDVGLGYLQLGQSSTTLSGGEAQRIKLSRELARVATGGTLYLLDEPTTGLHFDDIAKLLRVLDRLVEAGNTVVVIEHNLDVIRCADWIVDLGPEGGAKGGRVVAEGAPETVAAVAESYTGQFLKKLLGGGAEENSRWSEKAPRRPQRTARSAGAASDAGGETAAVAVSR